VDDVRRRIERFLDRESEGERRKYEERERKREQEYTEYQRWYNDRLKKHQSKFKCNICKTPSEAPGKKVISWETGQMGYVEHTEPDWGKPRDMKRCKLCNAWNCGASSCMYLGICLRCGSQL
jgi:hypothetical protein